jgi:hypothetical protein
MRQNFGPFQTENESILKTKLSKMEHGLHAHLNPDFYRQVLIEEGLEEPDGISGSPRAGQK